jgi:hypothetical protein
MIVPDAPRRARQAIGAPLHHPNSTLSNTHNCSTGNDAPSHTDPTEANHPANADPARHPVRLNTQGFFAPHAPGNTLFADVVILLYGHFPTPGPPRVQMAALLSSGQAYVTVSLTEYVSEIARRLEEGMPGRGLKYLVMCTSQESAREFLLELSLYSKDPDAAAKIHFSCSAFADHFVAMGGQKGEPPASTNHPRLRPRVVLSDKYPVPDMDGWRSKYGHQLVEVASLLPDATNDCDVILVPPLWLLDSIANYTSFPLSHW